MRMDLKSVNGDGLGYLEEEEEEKRFFFFISMWRQLHVEKGGSALWLIRLRVLWIFTVLLSLECTVRVSSMYMLMVFSWNKRETLEEEETHSQQRKCLSSPGRRRRRRGEKHIKGRAAAAATASSPALAPATPRVLSVCVCTTSHPYVYY